MSSERAVTVRCLVCGLEVTGVRNPETGLVYASDRSRPDPATPVIEGYCMTHAPNLLAATDGGRICHKCGQPYRPGTYGRHTRDPRHRAALRPYQPHPKPADIARQTAIVAALIGPPRRSLEAVGAEFHLTRERIRQIALKVGVVASKLPPLPPKPRKVRMATCWMCKEPYPAGQFRAHINSPGHGLRHPDDPTAQTVLGVLKAGGTWTEAAAAAGIDRGNVGLYLRRVGWVGYGWHPHLRERNRQIAKRYFVDNVPPSEIARELGMPVSTVINVQREVRSLGGYDQIERLMPPERVYRVRPEPRRGKARALFPEIRRRVAAKEKPLQIAKALGIGHSTVYALINREHLR